MSPRQLLLSAAALLALSAPAIAEDVAITNATVVIGDGSAPIPNGTVVLRGGKVLAAGAGVAVPAGARTIDASGKWVTPGLVVAVTDIGLFDVEGVDESNDEGADKGPFSAALDLSPAINPLAQHIAVSRAGGVTRAAVAPLRTGAIFGGQGAVIDLASDGKPITQARAFQLVQLGEDGARAAGGSRAAVHAVLRNAFMEARELARRGGGQGADPRLQDAAPERPGDALLTRFDAAALVPVVTGRQPLYVRAERAADIRMALALKTDFPALKMVIVGATEGWIMANELVACGRTGAGHPAKRSARQLRAACRDPVQCRPDGGGGGQGWPRRVWRSAALRSAICRQPGFADQGAGGERAELGSGLCRDQLGPGRDPGHG